MDSNGIKKYIRQRIHELNKEDERKVGFFERFNLIMNKEEFRHLPSWHRFQQLKKRLIRLIWFEAFVTVLLLVVILTDDIWTQLEAQAVKTAAWLLAWSAGLTLVCTIGILFSLAIPVNQTEKALRRLLYEDILDQLDRK